MEKWNHIEPTEKNGFCLFCPELENDPFVFFHATPLRCKDSILENGFQSAASLGTGDLTSVSYSKKSAACLAHVNGHVSEDYAVFAVRFTSLDRVFDNPSDIHVYIPSLQPDILGYCVLKAGLRIV